MRREILHRELCDLARNAHAETVRKESAAKLWSVRLLVGRTGQHPGDVLDSGDNASRGNRESLHREHERLLAFAKLREGEVLSNSKNTRKDRTGPRCP